MFFPKWSKRIFWINFKVVNNRKIYKWPNFNIFWSKMTVELQGYNPLKEYGIYGKNFLYLAMETMNHMDGAEH